MASKKPVTPGAFRLTVKEEASLIRIGLAGPASTTDANAIRRARESVSGSTLPILVVDEGLTEVTTVAYGALVQWAGAVRNRNIGWVMATTLRTAGRMFQMANMNPEECLHTSEEAARKALDRGRAGERITSVSTHSLALEGLRRK